MQLDHLGFLVTDLARVAARAGRSGFDLSDPVALTDGDGRPTGGVQQVTVFEEGYLEFQELTELGLGHVLERLVVTAPLVAVLAYASDDLDSEVAVLREAGVPLSDPVTWSRETENGRARFRFSVVDRDRGPVRVLVDHLTPELVHRPGTATNGVVALAGVARDEGPLRRTWQTPEAVRSELLDDRPVTRLALAVDRLASRSGGSSSDEDGPWPVEGDRMLTRSDLGVDLELVAS